MLRRVLICLAFATWCFLDTWVEYAEGSVDYFARFDPVRTVVIPILWIEVVIALGMWGLWELARAKRLDAPILHFVFLAACLAPAGIFSVALLRVLPFASTAWIRHPLFWPVTLALAVVPLAFICRRPRTGSRLAGGILLCSWPVLALVLVQAVRGSLLFPFLSYADGPLAAPLEGPAARVRVVWIIFDELSQTITFEGRPPGLELPNFDRLKRVSFYASAAESPANATTISMPSLIVGKRVLEAIPRGPGELRVRTEASAAESTVDWQSLPNVFDASRQLGYNTAVVGWALPYGRILNRSLTKCYWTAGYLLAGAEEPSHPPPLLAAMADRLRLQFAALPLAGHLPGNFPGVYHRQQKIERFSWLCDRAAEMVSDPTIGLVLIHLPVPHPPAIYSRSAGVLTANGRIGYLDSVALADRTLGSLRQNLEQSGLWDRTALLVSADHGWRTSIWRGDAEWTNAEESASHQDTSGVPFLLKLPGQVSGMQYARRFNTILTRELILGILSGNIDSPGALTNAISGAETH